MNRNKNRLLTFIKVSLIQLLITFIPESEKVLAGSMPRYTGPIRIEPPPGYELRYSEILGTVYDLLYPVAITYGIFEIIIAGYRIMKSEGEPKAMSEAKEHLTNSVVGILFVILAVIILRVIIRSFFSLNI